MLVSFSHTSPAQGSGSTVSDEKRSEILGNFMSMPVSFKPNRGQWDKTINYQASSQNGNIYFLNNSLSFAHRRDLEQNEEAKNGAEKNEYEILVWNISMEGAATNPEIISFGKKGSCSNYFLGNKKVCNVPEYQQIIYKNIYKNIDLKFYNASKDLEYDYILKPGADVKQIRMMTEGLEKISISKTGDLELKSSWGTIRERKPYAYQLINGKEMEIETRFTLLDEHTYGFEIVGDYDHSTDLVIDPVILSWSTFVGGTAGNGSGNINDLTLKNDFMTTDVYGTGYYNASYPTTAGVYNQAYSGGEDVLFVG